MRADVCSAGHRSRRTADTRRRYRHVVLGDELRVRAVDDNTVARSVIAVRRNRRSPGRADKRRALDRHLVTGRNREVRGRSADRSGRLVDVAGLNDRSVNRHRAARIERHASKSHRLRARTGALQDIDVASGVDLDILLGRHARAVVGLESASYARRAVSSDHNVVLSGNDRRIHGNIACCVNLDIGNSSAGGGSLLGLDRAVLNRHIAVLVIDRDRAVLGRYVLIRVNRDCGCRRSIGRLDCDRLGSLDNCAVVHVNGLQGLQRRITVGRGSSSEDLGGVLNGHITAIGLDIDVALGEDLGGILDEDIARAARNHRDGGFSRENRIGRGGILLLNRQIVPGLEIDRILACGEAVLDEHVITGIHHDDGVGRSTGRSRRRGDGTIDLDIAGFSAHLYITVRDGNRGVVTGLLNRHVLIGSNKEICRCARIELESRALVEHHATISTVSAIRRRGCGVVIAAKKRYVALGRNCSVLGSGAKQKVVVSAERHTTLGSLHRLGVLENDIAAIYSSPVGRRTPRRGSNSVNGFVAHTVIYYFIANCICSRCTEERCRIARVENDIALRARDVANSELGIVKNFDILLGRYVDNTVQLIGAIERHTTESRRAGISAEVGCAGNGNDAACSLVNVTILGCDGEAAASRYSIKFDRVAVDEADCAARSAHLALEVVVHSVEGDVGGAGVKIGHAVHDNAVRCLPNGTICRHNGQIAIVRAACINIMGIDCAKHDAACAGTKSNVITRGVDLIREGIVGIIDRDIIVRGSSGVLGRECSRSNGFHNAVERYVGLAGIDRKESSRVDLRRSRRRCGSRSRRCDTAISIEGDVACSAGLHLATSLEGDVALDCGISRVCVLGPEFDVSGRFNLLGGRDGDVAIESRHGNIASGGGDIAKVDRVRILYCHRSARRVNDTSVISTTKVVVRVKRIDRMTRVSHEVSATGRYGA